MGANIFTKESFKRIERFLKIDLTYLIKGGFLLSISKIIGIVTSLVTSIIFANYLPEETYGIFRYALTFFVLFSILSLSGLDNAVVRAIANGYDGTIRKAFKEKLAYGTLATLLGIAISIYYFWRENNTLGQIFLLGSLLIPLSEALYIYVAKLNGKKDFLRTTIFASISRIIAMVSLVVGVFFTNNAFYLVAIYIFSHLTSRAFFFYLTQRRYPDDNSVDEASIKFGKHLTVTQGIYQLAGNIDKILVFNFVGGAGLAGYYLALMPYKQISNLLNSISTLALPKLAHKNIFEIKSKLPLLTIKLYILIVPIVLLYIVSARFIFEKVLPLYTEYVFISQLIVCLLLLYPTTILQTALTSQNAKKELYQISIGASIVRIILLFCIIPFFGVMGAVSVILLTHTIQSLMTIAIFFHFVKNSDS